MTGTIWCLALANFASLTANKLKSNYKISYYVNKTCGLVLIGLGLKLALLQKK